MSINEPHVISRRALTPASINEPPVLPEWATETPVVDSIDPAEATIGGESFTIYVSGSGFYDQSVIVFAGQDEPTTFEGGKAVDGRQHGDLVRPRCAQGRGPQRPDPLQQVDFTFHPATEARSTIPPPEPGEMAQAKPAAEVLGPLDDPDEMEAEIEESQEEGDFTELTSPGGNADGPPQ